MQSVCETVPAGGPVVGTAAQCAEACDRMVSPTKCIGFQFFHMGGKDGSMPLCFLYKDIKKAYVFDCEWMQVGNEDLLKKEEKLLFLQKSMRVNSTVGEDKKIGSGDCPAVKAAVAYTGTTCEGLFG